MVLTMALRLSLTQNLNQTMVLTQISPLIPQIMKQHLPNRAIAFIIVFCACISFNECAASESKDSLFGVLNMHIGFIGVAHHPRADFRAKSTSNIWKTSVHILFEAKTNLLFGLSLTDHMLINRNRDSTILRDNWNIINYSSFQFECGFHHHPNDLAFMHLYSFLGIANLRRLVTINTARFSNSTNTVSINIATLLQPKNGAWPSLKILAALYPFKNTMDHIPNRMIFLNAAIGYRIGLKTNQLNR